MLTFRTSDFGLQPDFVFRILDFGQDRFPMSDAPHLRLFINGQPIAVAPGTVLAAALAQAGIAQFRRSVSGQPRGPVCGMGTCMECRVTVNGQPHTRSCQTLCVEGMEVRTDE